jgi:hypothetical protein
VASPWAGIFGAESWTDDICGQRHLDADPVAAAETGGNPERLVKNTVGAGGTALVLEPDGVESDRWATVPDPDQALTRARHEVFPTNVFITLYPCHSHVKC